MTDLMGKTGYGSFIERLNKFPQGAPPSELLVKILSLLFTDKEASMLSQLPVRPFSAGFAASLWGVREVEAFRLLEGLADRGLMLDMEAEGEKLYTLPPPMTGFFQFSLMRVRSDIDQEHLSELFHQYINMENDFIRELFTGGETRFGRIMVGEEEIQPAHLTRVYNYERASEVIKAARKIGIASCYCRQKAEHLGRACSAAKEICMTFDGLAESLIRHGHAREVETAECLDLLQQAREQNLVQFAENVRGGVSFICNCCGCCCESLIAARKFGSRRPIQTANFVVEVKRALCSGCGECVDACPMVAVALVSAKDAQHPWQRKSAQDSKRCLGCGVCVRTCRCGARSLVPRRERLVTPTDSAHRVVLMALERGKLQNLIWDNQALSSHRAMAAIIGAILRLPTVKQTLARTQLGSRYLKAIIERHAERSSGARRY